MRQKQVNKKKLKHILFETGEHVLFSITFMFQLIFIYIYTLIDPAYRAFFR